MNYGGNEQQMWLCHVISCECRVINIDDGDYYYQYWEYEQWEF